MAKQPTAAAAVMMIIIITINFVCQSTVKKIKMEEVSAAKTNLWLCASVFYLMFAMALFQFIYFSTLIVCVSLSNFFPRKLPVCMEQF